MADHTMDTTSGKNERTAESFKLYPFSGKYYAWEEWLTKFLAIALAKGVEDYVLEDPDGFFKVPTVVEWKRHKSYQETFKFLEDVLDEHDGHKMDAVK